MTTNSHMFTVRGTTFGAFCAASFFRPLFYSPRRWVLWKCSCSRRELPRQYCNLPHAHTLSSLLPLSQRCVFVGVREACTTPVCVCVQYEGCSCSRSTKPGPCVEMQPPGWAVLSLPTSPAGSRGSSWLVALCLQTDGNGQRRGEVENQRERERRRGEEENGRRKEKGRGGEGERVSLFSLSAVLKTTSPHNASAAADGPPLIQTHARTICTAAPS